MNRRSFLLGTLGSSSVFFTAFEFLPAQIKKTEYPIDRLLRAIQAPDAILKKFKLLHHVRKENEFYDDISKYPMYEMPKIVGIERVKKDYDIGLKLKSEAVMVINYSIFVGLTVIDDEGFKIRTSKFPNECHAVSGDQLICSYTLALNLQ